MTHQFAPGMRVTWDESNPDVVGMYMTMARDRHGSGPFVVTEVQDMRGVPVHHPQSVRIENGDGLGAWLTGAYFKPLEAAP